MHRLLAALVFALVAALGIASGAHALGSKTALRRNFESAADRVGDFGAQARETRRENRGVGTTIASECSYAARGAGNVADDAAKLIADAGYKANSLHHIFNPKHMLEPLVTKLGGQESALAALHKAVQPLAAQGYRTGAWVTVKVEGIAVSVKGAIVDDVFRISTATMRPF